MPRGPTWEVEHDRALLDAVNDPNRGWDWLMAGNRPSELLGRTNDSLKKRHVRMTDAQRAAAKNLKLPSATRSTANTAPNTRSAPSNTAMAPVVAPAPSPSLLMPPPPAPPYFVRPSPRSSLPASTSTFTPTQPIIGPSGLALTPAQLRDARFGNASGPVANPFAQDQSSQSRRSRRLQNRTPQVPSQSIFTPPPRPQQPVPAMLPPSRVPVTPSSVRYGAVHSAVQPRRSGRLQTQPPQYVVPTQHEDDEDYNEDSDEPPQRPLMRPHTYSRRQTGIHNMEDLLNAPVDTVLRRQYSEDLPNLGIISRTNLASDLAAMSVPTPRRGPTSTLAGNGMLNTPSLSVANRDNRYPEPIYANQFGDVRYTSYAGPETRRRRAARMLREFPPDEEESEEQ